MMQDNLTLPKMDGKEIKPGIFLIGEPKAVKDTDRLRCLADYHGALVVLELRLKFQ